MGIERTDPKALLDKELSQLVRELLLWMFLERRDKIDNNRRHLRMYRALDEPDLRPTPGVGRIEDDVNLTSNTYMPIVTGIIDTARTMIYQNLFGSNDYISCVSQHPEDEERAIFACRHLRNRHEQMGFKTGVAMDVIFEGLTYGTAVSVTDWVVRPGHVAAPVRNTREALTANGTIRFGETESELFFKHNAIDRVDTRLIPNNLWFNDPHADSQGFGQMFAFVHNVYIDELMLMRKTADNPAGIYEFDPDMIATGISSLFDGTQPTLAREVQTARNSVMNAPKVAQQVHLVTMLWEDYMVVMTGNGIVIRRQAMTGWPLHKWNYRPIPDEFGGLGIPDVLERMQYDVNAVINNRRDYENLILNPIAIIEEEILSNARLGTGELVPGQMYEFSGGGSAKDKVAIVAPGNQIGTDLLAELSLTMDVMKQTTGVGVNAQSQFASGRRSATEANVVDRALNTNMGMSSILLERQWLEPVFDAQMTMERLHLTEEVVLRDQGIVDAYFSVTPERIAFRNNPRLKALGTTHIIQNAVDRAQYIQALQASLLPQFQDLANLEEIYTEMWRMFKPGDHFRFINKPSPSQLISVEPSQEHILISNGSFPRRSQGDDDSRHLREHLLFKAGAGYAVLPVQMRRAFDNHISEHQIGLQEKNARVASNRGQSPGGGAPSQAGQLGSSPVAETQVA